MIAARRIAPFLICIAFVLAVPSTALPGGDGSTIEWVGDFDGALSLARKRVAPVFVTVSPGNADLRATENQREYGGTSVVDASRSFVCVIASFERHSGATDAGEKTTCSRFKTITCEEHIAVAAELKKRQLLNGGSVETGYLILNPAGELIDRQRPGITGAELLAFMGRGLAYHRSTAAAAIIKSLKNRKATVKAKAFQDAVSLLTEDTALTRLHDAGAKYLKRLKSTEDSRATRKIIAGANSEGALSLLVPFLRDRSPRTRIEALRVFAASKPRAAFLDALATHARVEKREDALQELVKVLDNYAPTFPKAVTLLNKLVKHRTPSVRALATLAAARPGNKSIYGELLKRCTREAHVAVRTSAILGLALMDAKAALPTLTKLRKKEGGDSDVARALDLAIRKLDGSSDVAFDFEQAVKRLKNAVVRTLI